MLFVCGVWLLFVSYVIIWVRRQCWATCPTVLPMGVAIVDIMFNREPMHRLAGSCSPSTGNCCHLVDLRIFPSIYNDKIYFLFCYLNGFTILGLKNSFVNIRNDIIVLGFYMCCFPACSGNTLKLFSPSMSFCILNCVVLVNYQEN